MDRKIDRKKGTEYKEKRNEKSRDERENSAQEERPDLIIGRNAVSEALRSERLIDTLLVARGERNGSIGRIIAECKDKNIVVKEVDKKKLDFMCGQGNHQGVAAYAAAHKYAEVEDIFALAEERGEEPFIIICDEIEDPHNLGAIIRTAETTGVHGIIIPKRRNASLSYAVGKYVSSLQRKDSYIVRTSEGITKVPVEKIIYFENKYCINKPCDYLKAEIKKEVETEENENEFINILKSSTKEASVLVYLPLLPLSVVMMPIMFVATWGIAFFTVNTNDELGLLR